MSAYSVWFVVHWFTYGAGVVVAVIYISEESSLRAKYHIHAIEFVFLGLLMVCVLYLFVFSCACAAMITSNCAGKTTDRSDHINKNACTHNQATGNKPRLSRGIEW